MPPQVEQSPSALVRSLVRDLVVDRAFEPREVVCMVLAELRELARHGQRRYSIPAFELRVDPSAMVEGLRRADAAVRRVAAVVDELTRPAARQLVEALGRHPTADELRRYGDLMRRPLAAVGLPLELVEARAVAEVAELDQVAEDEPRPFLVSGSGPVARLT